MPHQGPQRIPAVAVLVNISHTAPQTRLQILRVVLEQQHDHAPRQRRKRGPGVVGDLRVQRLARHDGQAVAGLDGDARQGQGDAGEDVDDNLLVDGRDLAVALGALSEDDVAAEEAGKEGVEGACLQQQCVSEIIDKLGYIYEGGRRKKTYGREIDHTLLAWCSAVAFQRQHCNLVYGSKPGQVHGMLLRRPKD